MEAASGCGTWATQYDVFLSFRGADTRHNFTDCLYRTMVGKGILAYRDSIELHVGGRIDDLLKAVGNSKICIPILSRGYAWSAWCLRELASMIELNQSTGKPEIIPIFVDVTPSDIKLRTKPYRQALEKHERRHGSEIRQQWETALRKVGEIRRWEAPGRAHGEIIDSIVWEILSKLKIKYNYVPEDLSIGEKTELSSSTWELKDSQKSKILELLELKVNDVKIIGIHGRDGIGKTTLAKIVYDQISFHFDACTFLAEVEETTWQPGGVQYLQTKLIFDILKREYEVAFAFEELQSLKEIFRNMKVLIVLDDVKTESFLENLVGAKLDWFGSGSRIIVTSDKSRVLQGFVTQGVACTYSVNPMDDNLAFNFFWQYAANGKSDEHRSYVKITIELVKAAKGLPLLLKVFGSFLHDKGLEEWIEFRDLIQQCQEDYQKILREIYEDLDQKQKRMYLDIACFPPDVDCRIASYMWHRYDYPHDEIEVLRGMSLIEIEENKIGMHSMLRCLAREISREGSHHPGTGVGFYNPAIAKGTNKEKKKTGHLSTEVAGHEILPKTTFLSLGRANAGGKFAAALSNVQWLHWQGCPQDEISTHLEENENLIILDLSWSKITESWGCWKGKKMECLKVLNLTGCADLLVIPSFSCCPNLEILILERCSQLVHLDPSINDLKLLVTLNLKFCSELSMLPVEMDGMNALKELLIDDTLIRELPASIGKLAQLQILSATNCFSLVRVPGSVRELTALSVLALDDAKILELPESIGYLGKLRRLSLRDCRGLKKLPEFNGGLADSLVELDISGTRITKLPNSTKNLRSLEVLKMDSCFVKEFPHNIRDLKGLQVMDIKFCTFLQELPEDIGCLEALKQLYIDGTDIRAIDFPEGSYGKLEILSACNCKISSLSDSIGNLNSLSYLALDGTELTELPDSIGLLKNLRTLSLRSCRGLWKLPDSIGHLEELQVMDLSETVVAELPSSVENLRNLKVLKMHCTFIREFPGGIKNLERLGEIDFSGCRSLTGECDITGLSSLRILLLENTEYSQVIGTGGQCSNFPKLRFRISNKGTTKGAQHQFHGHETTTQSQTTTKVALKQLYIDGTDIKAIDFPEDLFGKLEILCACNCKISYLSNSIGNLKSLFYLALDRNELIELPDSIGLLKNLQTLSLRSCRGLWKLPDSIGLLKNLWMLSLRSCRRLRKLPDSIGNLKELQFMDLSYTLVNELPSSVENLRNLKVLKMACTFLREFPGGIKNLERLGEINFSDCRSLMGECDITGLSSLRILLLENTEYSQVIGTDGQRSDFPKLRFRISNDGTTKGAQQGGGQTE